MSASHRLLKFLRLLHLYLGVFTAPMLLFFAITGGLQTFGLHERSRGSDYAPPAWLATMAQLHKKQTTVLPQRRPSPGSDAPAGEHRAGADGAAHAAIAGSGAGALAADHATPVPAPAAKAPSALPLKLFFALVSLGLLISTLSGLYMAYRYTRHPLRITAILLAGVAAPIVLAML